LEEEGESVSAGEIHSNSRLLQECHELSTNRLGAPTNGIVKQERKVIYH
jgi:hypothetical protein